MNTIVIETCPECGSDLIEISLDTFPPYYYKQCPKCKWSSPSKQSEVVRVPYGTNIEEVKF